MPISVDCGGSWQPWLQELRAAPTLDSKSGRCRFPLPTDAPACASWSSKLPRTSDSLAMPCVSILTRLGNLWTNRQKTFSRASARERALPARSDPLTAREGKTKCGTKNEQMKELACNSDPCGLFLSSSNKKCNSCDEYSPTVVFLPSNNNFNWTLQHVESLCFLGHKSNMWSRDLKNGLLKDSNASISPRTQLINLLCKMITFYREESLLDIH